MTADGWQARVLSWALAILATLAIVGAVATMSTNTPGVGGATVGEAGVPVARVDPRTGEPIPEASPAPFTQGAPRVPQPTSAAMQQADALRDIAGWLAVLTWAVLALVAVAAVAVLALFRIAHQRAER